MPAQLVQVLPSRSVQSGRVLASVARTLLRAARPTHEVPRFAGELATLEQQRCPVKGCWRTHGPRTHGQRVLLARHSVEEWASTPDAERHWGAALARVAPGSIDHCVPSLVWAPVLVEVRHGMVRHAPLPEAKQVPASPIAEIQDRDLLAHASLSGANWESCVELHLPHIGEVST